MTVQVVPGVIIIRTPTGPRGLPGLPALPAAIWSTTGSYTANEIVGTIPLTQDVTLNPAGCLGWCDIGGPAATSVWTIKNTAGLLIATITFSPSIQAPVIAINTVNLLAGWKLQLIAPASVDLNLTGVSVSLASV